MGGCPQNFKVLPRSEGFAFNLSGSRTDRLAERAACDVFGEERVADIMSRFHRSHMNYDDLLSDLREYERVHVPSCREDPIYQLAFMSVRQDLIKKEKIIPYTTGAVVKLSDFPRTKSPGLPYKLEGAKTKQQAVDEFQAVERSRVMWHQISYGKPVQLPDVCLYARAQVCSVTENKIRATWGYPLDVYLEEARFFYPVLDYVSSKECALPIAYGLEMATGGMEHVFSASLCNEKYVMTDWSRFDKTIPPWLIRDAFFLVSELIDFGHVLDSENKIWRVRSWRSAKRWKRMVDYFVQTPIRTSKGERFEITGGVPSGSCWTNIIDTIINILVTRYLSYAQQGRFPDAEIYLGDDAVLFYKNAVVDLLTMSQIAQEKFGMILNTNKSYWTNKRENIHFLGYYCMGGVPYKPQDTLIASFVSPERTRKTVVEAAAAALGQMWSGFCPVYAVYWKKILDYMNDVYPFRPDDVLLFLTINKSRHKYLKLVGIDADTLSYPDVSEWNLILDVVPKNKRIKEIPQRKWDYTKLATASYLFWH